MSIFFHPTIIISTVSVKLLTNIAEFEELGSTPSYVKLIECQITQKINALSDENDKSNMLELQKTKNLKTRFSLWRVPRACLGRIKHQRMFKQNGLGATFMLGLLLLSKTSKRHTRKWPSPSILTEEEVMRSSRRLVERMRFSASNKEQAHVEIFPFFK